LIEQFAQSHTAEVTVLGIGFQDHLDLARQFTEMTGTTFTMLWSEHAASWQHFGVSSNSSIILLDASGERIDESPQRWDEGRIAEQLVTLA